MDQYIKIQRIADDLAEHPLLADIPYDRIVNYAFELIRIIGSPKLYVDKVARIPIHEYRGELPCDYVDIISVSGEDGREYVTTMDNFFMDSCKPVQERKCGVGSIEVTQVQKTEGCCSYIEKTVKAYAPTDTPTVLGTYKIQGNIIFTDYPETVIRLAYRAIPVDEDGFPMLPNNAAFIRAIEAYITVKRFEILFSLGKINGQVLQLAQQEYAWAVGQASVDLIMPTQDEMETITHVWNTLLPRSTEHRNGFAHAHRREYIKKH